MDVTAHTSCKQIEEVVLQQPTLISMQDGRQATKLVRVLRGHLSQPVEAGAESRTPHSYQSESHHGAGEGYVG